MTRPCYHFSRKITVDCDDHQGRAQFPWGLCEMRADCETPHFAVSAEEAEALARVQHTIDEHVKLFARKTPLAVQWSAVASAQAATDRARQALSLDGPGRHGPMLRTGNASLWFES